MSQQNYLELARQGDPSAIAVLINRNLQSKGITAKVSRKGNCLQVLLESDKILKQDNLITFLHSGILKLGITEINAIQVFGRQVGDEIPTWSRTINLKMPVSHLTDQQSVLETQVLHSERIQNSVSSPKKKSLGIQNSNSGSSSGGDAESSELFLLQEAAQKRDLKAISSLVHQEINSSNITVEAEESYGGTLWLKLHVLKTMQSQPVSFRLTSRATEPKSCIQAVIKVLNDIKPDKVHSARISEIASDKKTQVWNRYLTLKGGKFVDNTASINLSLGILVVLIIGLIGYCGALPRGSSTSSSSEAIVKNSAWDGSVAQVKSWLNNNLKDPGSLEFIEWSPVQKNQDGGFLVRVKYRAKNSFGGYVIENKVFFLSSDGSVISSSDY